MFSLFFLAVIPSQTVDSAEFPKTLQQAAYDATVRIYHDPSRSAGTAVVVARKENLTYLLTAAHLVPEHAVEGRESLDLRLVELTLYSAKDPNKIVHGEARVVARMPNEDLAVLETKLPNPPIAVPICPRAKLKMKLPMTVMTVGTEPDGPPSIVLDQLRKSLVVKKPDMTEALYWEADIPQRTGRSGGPMIDSRGYVIGIASGTQHKKGYYISTDEMLRALQREGFEWFYKEPASKK